MPTMKENVEFGYYVAAFIDLLGQSEALKEFQRLPNKDNPEEMQKFLSIAKKTFGIMHGFHDSFDRFFSGYSNREERFNFTEEQKRLYDQMGSNEIKQQRFSDGLLYPFPYEMSRIRVICVEYQAYSILVARCSSFGFHKAIR